MANTERVRLHITPFNSDLLERYIPPALKPHASNISFHTIETFPEQGFGYVELPVMEAQKLKRKLNGSTLKGAKVKIEEAKPEKKRKSVEPVEDEKQKVHKKAKKEKRKREDGVRSGHELPEGRHIKRGWVEDVTKKGKKSKVALEGKKMHFRTEVPANKVIVDEKEKKAKKPEEKKVKKRATRAIVVKEFSKASKPNTTAALRGKRSSGYEDGKGWIDVEGNVVEQEPETRRQTRSSKKTDESERAPVPEPEPAIENSLPSESEDEDDSSSASLEEDASTAFAPMHSDNEEVLDRQLSEAKSNTATNAAAELERRESTLVGDAVQSPEVTKEVHPLEALFKLPAPPKMSPKRPIPTPIDTSFSFFSADDDAGEDSTSEAQVPQTPHTKQDLAWRSIRSAAPTPDTAALGKKFNFSFGSPEPESDIDDDDDEDVDMTDVIDEQQQQATSGAASEGKEESEFRKWFYDNRGDLNRAWKKRRREEKKVVRQRENRRMSRRIA